MNKILFVKIIALTAAVVVSLTACGLAAVSPKNTGSTLASLQTELERESSKTFSEIPKSTQTDITKDNADADKSIEEGTISGAGNNVTVNNTLNKASANGGNPNKDSILGSTESLKTLDDQYLEGFNAFMSGRYEDAAAIENAVIEKDSKYFKAFSVKGIALCYAGNFEMGMESIDKALQLNPDFGYGRFNKALAFELYGYYDDAIKWYNKDLEIENYPWSYYGIASIYGRRGDVDNTVKYLKAAFELSPDTKTAAKGEKDFNNVRSSTKFKELF